jgi:hypothetical protein
MEEVASIISSKELCHEMNIFLKAYTIDSVLFVHASLSPYRTVKLIVSICIQDVFRVCWSSRAGIFKQYMDRVGIGLSYRPARLHRLAGFIPWNRFLGFINV